MGEMKNLQVEAEEKAADPLFRLAVIIIFEDLMRKVFDRMVDILGRNFVHRAELRNLVFKKKG